MYLSYDPFNVQSFSGGDERRAGVRRNVHRRRFRSEEADALLRSSGPAAARRTSGSSSRHHLPLGRKRQG